MLENLIKNTLTTLIKWHSTIYRKPLETRIDSSESKPSINGNVALSLARFSLHTIDK